MNEKENSKAYIIVGKIRNGEPFRPSDWADRLCGSLSTFKNNRICYSPLLYPSLYEGHRCIIADFKLKDVHPELFKYLMEFAKKNQLTIIDLSADL